MDMSYIDVGAELDLINRSLDEFCEVTYLNGNKQLSVNHDKSLTEQEIKTIFELLNENDIVNLDLKDIAWNDRLVASFAKLMMKNNSIKKITISCKESFELSYKLLQSISGSKVEELFLVNFFQKKDSNIIKDNFNAFCKSLPSLKKLKNLSLEGGFINIYCGKQLVSAFSKNPNLVQINIDGLGFLFHVKRFFCPDKEIKEEHVFSLNDFSGDSFCSIPHLLMDTQTYIKDVNTSLQERAKIKEELFRRPKGMFSQKNSFCKMGAISSEHYMKKTESAPCLVSLSEVCVK